MKVILGYPEREWLIERILRVLEIAEKIDRKTGSNPAAELFAQVGEYFDKTSGKLDYAEAISYLLDQLPEGQNYVVLKKEEGFDYDVMKLTWFPGWRDKLVVDVEGHDTIDFPNFVKEVRDMIQGS